MSKKLMYGKWFTAVADEIREIKDSDEKINAQDFENNILSLGTPKRLKEILDKSHSMSYYFSAYYIAYMADPLEPIFSYYGDFPITADIPFDLTENVYDFSYTFQFYLHDKVPIFDMSKAKDLTCTFRYCKNLVEYINPSFGQNYKERFRIARSTFWDCTNLKKVKVYYPTATYTEIKLINNEPTYTADEKGNGIFTNCYSLETIDVVELYMSSFYGNSLLNCYSLKNIVIRSDDEEGDAFRYFYFLINGAIDTCCHFTGEVNEKYNPKGLKDGKVYIRDEFVENVKSYAKLYNVDNFIYPLSEYKE